METILIIAIVGLLLYFSHKSIYNYGKTKGAIIAMGLFQEFLNIEIDNITNEMKGDND